MGEVLTDQEAALYDRQLRIWGVEAQKRLSRARFLILEMSGTLAEACKNIVLAGVGAVTLCDDRPVSEDIARFNFLVSADAVGSTQTVAEACCSTLRELNPMVRVAVLPGPVYDKPVKFFADFDVVVMGRTPLSKQVQVNRACRQLPHRVAFYTANCRGNMGLFFADLNRHSYTPQGVKDAEPVALVFPSLEEAMAEKWSKLHPTRTHKLLLAYQVVAQYEDSTEGHVGVSASDVPALLTARDQRAAAEGVSPDILPTSVLERFAAGGTSEGMAVAAILGGMLGQELIKCVSGKGLPVNNFFLFDALDGKGVVVRLPVK